MRLARLVLLAFSISTVIGCEDGLEPEHLLSVSVSPSDSTFFAGDSAAFDAIAEFRSGPRPPDTVAWSISDTMVAAIVRETGSQVILVGRGRGEAYLIANVDADFTDTARVEVVEPGDIRWRAQVGGDGGPWTERGASTLGLEPAARGLPLSPGRDRSSSRSLAAGPFCLPA